MFINLRLAITHDIFDYFGMKRSNYFSFSLTIHYFFNLHIFQNGWIATLSSGSTPGLKSL